jgi:hypothetical protein
VWERQEVETMTEAKSVDQALELIDRGLSDMQSRSLVSTTEVADLLLDVRLQLLKPFEPELRTEAVSAAN